MILRWLKYSKIWLNILRSWSSAHSRSISFTHIQITALVSLESIDNPRDSIRVSSSNLVGRRTWRLLNCSSNVKVGFAYMPRIGLIICNFIDGVGRKRVKTLGDLSIIDSFDSLLVTISYVPIMLSTIIQWWAQVEVFG